MLIDSHCHLHDREFFSEEQAEQALKNAKTSGVEQIICIGTSHEDSLAAKAFAESHEGVFWTYGIHPENTTRTARGGSVKSFLKQTLDASKLVAIGEVGLDYHFPDFSRPSQLHLFEQMLQLASDSDLPLSFHVREAFDDFFPVVANFPHVRGVVHSFTDSKKVLHRILDTTDFYVGVNGLATYSTLPTPPLDRILLETDAPFLTPAPNRGKINEPAYIKDIALWLSNKLGLSAEEIAAQTTSNVKQLFHLPDSVLR